MKSYILAILAAAVYLGISTGCVSEQLNSDSASTALNLAGSQERQRIDLDEPGEFESLRRSNPEHFAKIEEILTSIHERRVEDVPRWLQADFDADNVNYQPVLLVTDPPTRRMAITLDNTRYRMTLTVNEDRARPQLL